MSLYGALFSGVSSLSAQSQSMAVIADNISNVNTVGYKSARSNFSTLVTQSSNGSSYSAGGVRAIPQALIDRQGLLQSSASPTDIALSGNGFFVINSVSDATSTEGTFMFTRAGSFTADAEGFLRNSAGFYLQGWPIDSVGNIPANRGDLAALETVNVESLIGSAEATTQVSIQANLQASQVMNALVTSQPYAAGDMARPTGDASKIGADFERSVQVFDSQGGTQNITYAFLKADDTGPSGPNSWHVEAFVRPATEADATAHPNGLIVSGIMKFNTDGTLNLGSTTLPTTMNVTWAATLGISTSSLNVNFGSDGLADGMTQFDSPSILVNTAVNGAIFGALVGVSINPEGIVTALFDNGSRTEIYKLPIATFPNPNGVANADGNAFLASDESGDWNLQEAGHGNAGTVAPSALEASTVDLAEEFSNMIVTQRAFSAGSRVIMTADEMLDELVRIIR